MTGHPHSPFDSGVARTAASGHPSLEWTRSSIEVATDGSVSRRIEFWREMVLRLFADVQIQTVQQPDFFGKVRQRKGDKLRISDIQASEQSVQRRHRHARSEYEDKYFAVLMLEGSQAVEQDGKVVMLQPGDFAIYDATRPHNLQFGQPWREIVVSIPRHSLNQLVFGMERRTACPVSTTQGIGSVMRGFLEQMSSQMGDLSEEEFAALSDTAVSLIGMTLGNLRRNDLVHSRVKEVTLMRVKQFVLESLRDPELSPASIESETGISSRYVNKLFEVENTSLMRYVWNLRLERCAAELADARWQASRISDVALRWGFNDMSHFSRAFRARFDESPSAWREMRRGNVASK